MSATFAFSPVGLLHFKPSTPVRDFLRNLRRWLTYRPEQRYLGRPSSGSVKR